MDFATREGIQRLEAAIQLADVIKTVDTQVSNIQHSLSEVLGDPPNLFPLDPDPTLQLVLDPDSNLKQLFSVEIKK